MTQQVLEAPSATRAQVKPWRIVGAAGFGAAMAAIQQSAVLPMLPRLQVELGTSVTAVSWVFTISLLVGAVATPLLSRFGDMYGRRRMLLFALGSMLVGSVIAAFAENLPTLLAGRVVQAMSMATVPLAIGLVRDVLPREQMSTGIGVISATLGIGSGLGMVLSGVIAQVTTGFHALFWVIAVLSVVTFVFAFVFVKDATPPRGGRADLVGAVLLAAALVSLLLGITQGSSWGWTSVGVLGLFAGAIVIGVVWVVVERRVAEPLVDVALLTHRGTIGASVASLLLGFAMFGGFTLLPQFVQVPSASGYGFGASVLQAGLFLLPTSLFMMVISPLAGGLLRRFSAPSMVAAGAVLTVLSYGYLVLRHDNRWDIVVVASLLGIGIGLAYAALATMAIEHVEPAKTGVASGVNSLVRLVGASVSGAVVAAILVANPQPHALIPSVQGYEWGFGVGAIGAAVAALFAIVFGRMSARDAARSS